MLLSYYVPTIALNTTTYISHNKYVYVYSNYLLQLHLLLRIKL